MENVKMTNPFNIVYGMIPNSLVARNGAFDQIIDAFTNPDVPAMTYLITGIRGSGKTVLLRSVAKVLDEKKNWIVADLNPQGNFISPLAERLYEENHKNKIDFGWSIDLSLPSVTFHVSKDQTTISAETAIRHFLEELKKRNKRVLITIDEVNPTKELKYFANFYQSLIGYGFPVFLLMTGLLENVDSLISGEATSFLARSPKIVLEPLDLLSISKSYQKALGCSSSEAGELAKLSQGYAFAYQVIGKICFEQKRAKIDSELLSKIDNYLAENGYNVIWKGMSKVEKKICLALAKSKNGETQEIVEKTSMSVKNFNNYRLRMIHKGYLLSNGYGRLAFALPRFREYVLEIEPLLNSNYF